MKFGRALAACFAVLAAFIPGYGTIDLVVPITEYFVRATMLEGGWGQLFSLLVTVPFVVVALNPAAARVALGEVLVAAAAVGITGVLAGRPRFMLVTLILGCCAALLHWMPHEVDHGRKPGSGRLIPVALTLTAAAAVSAAFGNLAVAAWLAVVMGVYGLSVLLSRHRPAARPRHSLLIAVIGAAPWIWYPGLRLESAAEPRNGAAHRRPFAVGQAARTVDVFWPRNDDNLGHAWYVTGWGWLGPQIL